MVKENNCVVCGLCSTFFDVKIKPENRLAGVVKYKGPCEVCCKCVCDCDCNCDCCGCGCSICCGICEICKVCSNCKDICYNYFYCCDILSNTRQLMYSIYLRRCSITICPTDCLNSLTFTIRSPGGEDVGKIEMRRNCCNCFGLFGKSCTYTIIFPNDATPDLKLTIINAVISIDMFGF